MNPIYLDHAASTPLRREVRDTMVPLLEQRYGNPSSVHRWGREARAVLENARAELASLLGAAPSEIVFTRGGSEADNLAVLGRARARPGAGIVCSAIEHKAVLAAARAAEAEGNPLTLLPVTPEGIARTDALDERLGGELAVVSVMWVNNEIGTIQPIAEMAARCADAGVVFHSDGIQAFGKLPLRVDRVPVDLLSISAHKIGGPKGVGALFVRKGTELAPLIHGGGHERGLRAGTEDVAGAAGLAKAASLAVDELEDEAKRRQSLRDDLERGLRARIPGLVVHGAEAARTPNILNVSIPGVDNETLLLSLDLEGIAVSSGSACSSGALTPSHVLTALGLPPEIALPCIRFSLGRETTRDEINRVLAVLPPLIERMRALVAV